MFVYLSFLSHVCVATCVCTSVVRRRIVVDLIVIFRCLKTGVDVAELYEMMGDDNDDDDDDGKVEIND